jgi:RNA polymerase sigma-70 factor (ECF subfamily)
MNDATQSAAVLPPEIESLLAETYARSSAGKYGIAKAEFGAILLEIRTRYLAPDASVPAIRELCLSLRVEDLALARACAAGNERAWETFMARFREKLYDIAGYIAKENSAARDLADSLYADLYGTVTRDGQRVCKLSSYTGRGSLEGWLRTVMAQEYVNRYRRQRRLVSLDEENEEGKQFAAPDPEPVNTVDPRVEAATDEVLSALLPEDRFVLAAYYLDKRTLAEIARMLGVHESTISRKLDKVAQALRKQILAALGRRGMSRRQAEEALQVDVRDLRLNIRTHLAQERDAKTFPEKAGAQAGEGSG